MRIEELEDIPPSQVDNAVGVTQKYKRSVESNEADLNQPPIEGSYPAPKLFLKSTALDRSPSLKNHKESIRRMEVPAAGGETLSAMECIKEGALLWLKVMFGVSPVLFANILFLWIFYLPAITLAPNAIDVIKEILYEKLLFFFTATAFWGSVVLTALDIFSYQFSKTAIAFVYLPVYLSGSILFLSSAVDSKILFAIRSYAGVALFGLGYYLIYRSKAPLNPTREEENYFKLTKDGSVLAAFKGLIAIFVIVVFVFYRILEIYLKSTFFLQLFFRFVVFPVCFNLTKWIQMRVIINLSKEDMDRRLLVNKMCNHQTLFIGRTLISNITTESALSFEFLSVNFLAAVVEFMSTVTFKQRMKIFYNIQCKAQWLRAKMYGVFKKRTLVPIVTGSNEDGSQVHNTVPVTEEKYVGDSLNLRLQSLYDGIVSEIYASVMAPLLMYFVHVLATESTLQPIKSFRECFYQIVIQVLFEAVSDTLSLGFEIWKGSIRPGDFERWVPMNRNVTFSWTIFCVLNMHGRASLFS